MAELINWKEALVEQKDRKLGTIPASFEWMIRFAKIKDVNFDTFQNDFNLQAKGICENNFNTITDAIIKKYPHMKINVKKFDNGLEKYNFLYDLVKDNIPCVLSFSISGKADVAHQMPVFSCGDVFIKMIWKMDKIENPDILRIEKDDFIKRHNKLQNGRELVWINK